MWTRSYDPKLHFNIRSNCNQQSWEVLFYLWYRNISFQMLSVSCCRKRGQLFHPYKMRLAENIGFTQAWPWTLSKRWVHPHIQDLCSWCFLFSKETAWGQDITYSLVHVVWSWWQKWMLQNTHKRSRPNTFFSILLAHLFTVGNLAIWRSILNYVHWMTKAWEEECCGTVLISGLIIVHRTSIIMQLLHIKVATGFFLYFILWINGMEADLC